MVYAVSATDFPVAEAVYRRNIKGDNEIRTIFCTLTGPLAVEVGISKFYLTETHVPTKGPESFVKFG